MQGGAGHWLRRHLPGKDSILVCRKLNRLGGVRHNLIAGPGQGGGDICLLREAVKAMPRGLGADIAIEAGGQGQGDRAGFALGDAVRNNEFGAFGEGRQDVGLKSRQTRVGGRQGRDHPYALGCSGCRSDDLWRIDLGGLKLDRGRDHNGLGWGHRRCGDLRGRRRLDHGKRGDDPGRRRMGDDRPRNDGRSNPLRGATSRVRHGGMTGGGMGLML